MSTPSLTVDVPRTLEVRREKKVEFQVIAVLSIYDTNLKPCLNITSCLYREVLFRVLFRLFLIVLPHSLN